MRPHWPRHTAWISSNWWRETAPSCPPPSGRRGSATNQRVLPETSQDSIHAPCPALRRDADERACRGKYRSMLVRPGNVWAKRRPLESSSGRRIVDRGATDAPVGGKAYPKLEGTVIRAIPRSQPRTYAAHHLRQGVC